MVIFAVWKLYKVIVLHLYIVSKIMIAQTENLNILGILRR